MYFLLFVLCVLVACANKRFFFLSFYVLSRVSNHLRTEFQSNQFMGFSGGNRQADRQMDNKDRVKMENKITVTFTILSKYGLMIGLRLNTISMLCAMIIAI